ncbi:MAG: SPOR domain-containing protein [bacterium]
MTQAKRKKKKPAPKRRTFSGFSSHGIGMLLAGVVIGALGTTLWQGYKSRESDVGSGIRQMIESSRQQAVSQEQAAPAPEVAPEPQSTTYDFFTVLPEIEVVVTADEEPEVRPAAQTEKAAEQSQQSESDTASQPQSAYMLQAGSFNSQSDAERQKASLGLIGLSSTIQKITIQGRGDFYRVRLGPYVNHQKMVETDERLKQEGIKALRLKVSKAG